MPSPEQLLAAAKQAFARGEQDVARDNLNEILRVEPENVEAWVWLARVAPDLQSARRALDTALMIDPASRQAMAGMEWVRKQEIQTLRARLSGQATNGQVLPEVAPAPPASKDVNPQTKLSEAPGLAPMTGSLAADPQAAKPNTGALKPLPKPQTGPLSLAINAAQNSPPIPTVQNALTTGRLPGTAPLAPWLAGEVGANTVDPQAAPARGTHPLAPETLEPNYRPLAARPQTAPLPNLDTTGTVAVPGARATKPLTLTDLGVEHEPRHQAQHSPTPRAAFSEVPLYPSAGVRQLLLSLEHVTSPEDVKTMLQNAGLESYIDNYPADDLDPGVPYSDYSALGRAMERLYGARTKEVQLKLGEEIVNGGQEGANRGMANSARKLIPGNLMLRRTLESLVDNAQELGVPVDLEDLPDSYRYIVTVCPYCYGRRTDIGCNALAGVLKATLRQASGKDYQVEEVTCRGRGDETCSYEIAKTPLD